MLGGCHGTDKLKTPTLEIKICPQCGNEIELFSIDTEMACDNAAMSSTTTYSPASNVQIRQAVRRRGAL